MKTREIKITDLKPYENNPRQNEAAVDKVAESIKQFGFKVPIVVDKDLVIVCGHTRLKAAEKLGLEKVPCVVADDLTEDQVKAFRLADNKTAEFAEWDVDKLVDELDELAHFDMTAFGFDMEELASQMINDETCFKDQPDDDFDNEPGDKKECTCPNCGFKFEL